MAELEYLEHVGINFADKSFRFASVKRFVWDRCGTHQEMLGAFINHPRFQDTFASPDSQDRDIGSLIHGPYDFSRISISDFERVDLGRVLRVVDEFCRIGETDPSTAALTKIDSEVRDTLRRADAWYELRTLPEDAIHSWGYVLMDFHELIAISQTNGTLVAIVLAID